jgi:hypothetical protein
LIFKGAGLESASSRLLGRCRSISALEFPEWPNFFEV